MKQTSKASLPWLHPISGSHQEPPPPPTSRWTCTIGPWSYHTSPSFSHWSDGLCSWPWMATCLPACCQDRAGPQYPSNLAKGSVVSVGDPHAPGVAFCPVLSGLCTALCICQSSFVPISLLEFHGTPVSCHYLHLSGRNEAQESET